MIVEYKTEPQLLFAATPAHWVWHSRRAIDLRYVTSAEPGHEDAVKITLVGESQPFRIAARDFDEFVRLWRSAVEGADG